MSNITAKIYVRLSRDEEGQTSTADQERECRHLAARLGITDIRLYLEQPGTSGFKDVARPVFDELLANLADNDVVLAWALDRLTRKGMEQAGAILRRLEESGARLVTVSDGVDTAVEIGNDINVGIRAIMAREYSKGISRNVKRGKITGAVAGRWGGGPRWYGYALDSTGVWRGPREIDVEQAEVLRDIRKRYVAGEAFSHITKDLNSKGIYTASGTPWRMSNLLRHLLNPRYAGIRVHHEERYQADWPAIFTLEEHEEVLASRNSVQRMKAWPINPGGVRNYLLTGFLECGVCGYKIQGHAHIRKGNRHRRYACGHCHKVYRSSDPVDMLVMEAVLFRLDTPDLGNLLTSARDDQPSGIIEEVEAKRRKLDSLVDDYANDLLDRAQFQRAKSIAETALQAAQAVLQREMTQRTNLHLDVGQTLRDAFTRNDMAWQRRLLMLLIEKIVIKQSNTGGMKKANYWNGHRFRPEDVEIRWLV